MPTPLQKRQLQRGRAASNRRKVVNDPTDEDSSESIPDAEIQDTKEENLELDDSEEEQDEEEEEQDTKEEDSESYKDEYEDEDDEEEEEEIPVPTRLSPRLPTIGSSSTTSRTERPARMTRSKRGREISADTEKKDESSEDDVEEDSHFRKQSKPARKRSQGRRKVRSAPKRRTENRRKDISSSSDHEDDSGSEFQDEESLLSETNEADSDSDLDDEEEWNRPRKGRQKKETNSSLRRSSRRTPRNKKATTHANDQDDESDDAAQGNDDVSHARVTPKRSCTKQTNEKIASVVALIEKSKSEMDSEDSDGVQNQDTKFSRTLSFSPDRNDDHKKARSNRSSRRLDSKKKNSKQSKKRRRYGVKTSDDDDEEYEENEESGSESEVVLDSEDDELIEDAAKNEKGNVDMDNIYDTDSTGNSVNFKKRDRMVSPVLKIKHFNKKKSAQRFNDDDSDSDAYVNDFKTTPSQTPPSIPFCPSTEDRITAEELPEKHICFVTPDRKTRHCFNLTTLRKIALSASIKQYGADGKLLFLQPPHFRSAMDDDLLDQIASRFGRGALDLNGDYYKKSYTTWGDATCTSSEQSFDDQVHRYVQGIMGHTDLYCCPVCYCEAEAKSTGATEDSGDDDDSVIEDTESKTNHFTNKVDPMGVLGFLDNDEFQVASTFCFRNVATLKQHLRHVHDVDTSGLDGNNLYTRFKIRAPDGLLQQHTHTMASYWRSGNNHSFVYLLALVDERTHRNLERETEGNRIEDVSYDETIGYESAEEFSRSFPNRAKKLWNAVSAPYTSGYQDDEIGDFIVDGDIESEEEEEHVPPPMIHNLEKSHLSPEEEIALKLREIRKRKRIGDFSSESDSEHEEGDSEDELEVLKPRAYQSDIVDTDSGEDGLDASDQSEDDDWMRNKRKKSKTFLNKQKRTISKRSKGIEAHVNFPLSTSPSPRKKQFRIQESDED